MMMVMMTTRTTRAKGSRMYFQTAMMTMRRTQTCYKRNRGERISFDADSDSVSDSRLRLRLRLKLMYYDDEEVDPDLL